jgi:predicted transcriptional regulator
MAKRTLIITVESDWRKVLRGAAAAARSDGYRGERLNFETPADLFERLTAARWALVDRLMGGSAVALGDLARQMGREIAQIEQDVAVLTEIGLLEQITPDEVACPYSDIRVDMQLHAAGRAA